MRRGEELFGAKESPWLLVGAEYPVQLNEYETHIDFVYRLGDNRVTTFLVAECKRVDPVLGYWFFVKAPYTWYDPDDNELAFDELWRPARAYGISHRPRFAHTAARPICRIAREIKVPGVTGSGEGRSREGAIEDALAQALRGVGGLLEKLRGDSGRYSDEEKVFRFIPVVFTTAELWVGDIDLGSADLRTGKLPEGATAKPVTWLWFVHNRTPRLTPLAPPAVRGQALSTDLRLALRSDSARAVAIVGANGVDEFYKSPLPDWEAHSLR